MILAGYGLGGNGISGFDGLDYPLGTLRFGVNEYDGWSGTQAGDGDLIFDFDDGTVAHDALGDLGLGAAEAFVAPGDSGGPSSSTEDCRDSLVCFAQPGRQQHGYRQSSEFQFR